MNIFRKRKARLRMSVLTEFNEKNYRKAVANDIAEIIAEKDAEKDAALTEKDAENAAALAEKDAEIARLKELLAAANQ